MITSERLRLRPLDLNDASNLHFILSDSETMRYYPHRYSLEQTRKWIERSIQSYADNNYGLWAVELIESGDFIGQCGISNQTIDGYTVPEIGFHIHKHYWRKGYGTEAARASMNFGFELLGLETLYLITSTENLPARKVACKLGMDESMRFSKNFLQTLTIEHILFKKTYRQWKRPYSN